ncbi:Inner membrane protein YhcB [Serratia symbiotica]|nr:Inner membrane protein YhcB [Serratia symbiotica]
MTWGYAIVGLVVGIILGAIMIRFSTRNLGQQQILQRELAQSKSELEKYRQELVIHFAYSGELLNNITKDYHQLCQHMAQSYNNLLPDLATQKNLFSHQLNQAEVRNDTAVVEIPRDYSEDASGLLHSEEPRRN